MYTVKSFDYNNGGEQLNSYQYESIVDAQRIARGESDQAEIGLAGIYDEEDNLIVVYLGGFKYDFNDFDKDYVNAEGISLRSQIEQSHIDILGF